MKSFTPHPFRFAQHLLHWGEGFETLPSGLCLPPYISGTAFELAFNSVTLYLISKYRDFSRYFTKSFDPTFKEPQR